MSDPIKYYSLGEGNLVVAWEAKISQSTLRQILVLRQKLCNKNILGVIEISNTYHSLVIDFNPNVMTRPHVLEHIEEVISSQINYVDQGNLWKLPVCYESDFALDKQVVEQETELSFSEIVDIHTSSTYLVYFIGFLPGFLYLGGLSNKLIVPRKSQIRRCISPGAVGIAEQQTGIYPLESPSGWQIIGHCPISLFNPTLDLPCQLKPGDQLSFYSINANDHANLLHQPPNLDDFKEN